MQTGNYDDILLRARYYLSSSDVATTKRRTKFKDIRETYILFICKDDPFGAGIPRYTRFSKFLEVDGIPYDDKIHNVFYNCSAWEKEEDSEIREVLKFIYGLKPDSALALDMVDAVSLAKRKSDLEEEYMYFSDILESEKEEAREIGLSEGRAEGLELGRQQQKLEAARNLLHFNVLTPSQIAQTLDMPLDEVVQLSKELGD